MIDRHYRDWPRDGDIAQRWRNERLRAGGDDTSGSRNCLHYERRLERTGPLIARHVTEARLIQCSVERFIVITAGLKLDCTSRPRVLFEQATHSVQDRPLILVEIEVHAAIPSAIPENEMRSD
jgi:hypothetical protein